MLLSTPGIEVNKTNALGETPLFLAAMQGNAPCVQLLLRHPATDTQKKDKNGRTPLQMALIAGNAECVSLLRNTTTPQLPDTQQKRQP